MTETQELAYQFLQRLKGEGAGQQFPDLMMGIMRAFKQEAQQQESELCEKEEMLRYSERAALVALCCCCALNEADGVRTALIGEALDLAPSTVTPLLDALEQKGLITRRRMDSDRRIVMVSPTESGWRTALQYRERNRKRFEKMLCWLGEEDSTQLLRILKRISAYYEKESN